MPTATETSPGSGMYRLEWADGTTYNVPYETAIKEAPESFPDEMVFSEEYDDVAQRRFLAERRMAEDEAGRAYMDRMAADTGHMYITEQESEEERRAYEDAASKAYLDEAVARHDRAYPSKEQRWAAEDAAGQAYLDRAAADEGEMYITEQESAESLGVPYVLDEPPAPASAPTEADSYGPGSPPTLEEHMAASAAPRIRRSRQVAPEFQPVERLGFEGGVAQPSLGGADLVAPPTGPSPDTAQYGPGHPPTIENQMAQAGRPAPGAAPALQPGQSRSVSGSYSGTGPYQEARPVDPAAQPSFQQEQQWAQDAAQKRMAASDIAQAGMAETVANQGALIEQQRQQNLETVAEQQRIHEEAMAEVEAEEESLSAARNNVSRMDMGKVWQDTSANAKFVGLMSAAIAGFLNPTGKNSVIEQMSRMVDQSAREQAANIATEKFQIAGQERALGRLEDRFEDSEKRYLAQRELLMSNLVAQIGHEKTKYDSIITLNNLEQLEAGAMEQLAQTTQQRRQLTYQNAFQEKQAQRLAEHQRAQRRLAAAKFRWQKAEAKKAEEAKGGLIPGLGTPLFSLPSGGTVFTKGGPLGVPIKDEESRKVRDLERSSKKLAKHGTNLQQLLQDYSRWDRIGDLSKKAAVEQQIGEALLAMRPIIGANQTGEEVKIELKRWGNPKSVINNPNTAKVLIKNTVDSMEDDFFEAMNTYGAVVVEPDGVGGVRGRALTKEDMGLGSFDMSAPGEYGMPRVIQDVAAMKEDVANATSDVEREQAKLQLTMKVEALLDQADKFDLTTREHQDIVRSAEEVLRGISPEDLTTLPREGEIMPRIPYGVKPIEAFRANVQYLSAEREEAREKAKRDPGDIYQLGGD